MRDGVAAAERTAGGRLDPPLLCVLDEAANICRIGDLPALYSHLGSRGIVPLTVLQSYAQGAGVWGDNGMKALWGAATIKVVGAGIDDASFAEDLSRLIGDSDVDVVTVSVGDGKRSRSRSVQQRRILPAAELRALPKGRVLILSTGAKAALAHAAPWYTGPRRAEITAAINRANTALAERARHSRPAGSVGTQDFPTEEIVLPRPAAATDRTGTP
jgi:type IV secretory pathway TraG/TraD family ATPase VirD4